MNIPLLVNRVTLWLTVTVLNAGLQNDEIVDKCTIKVYMLHVQCLSCVAEKPDCQSGCVKSQQREYMRITRDSMTGGVVREVRGGFHDGPTGAEEGHVRQGVPSAEDLLHRRSE